MWHDLLYEGPRNPGWPNENTLLARAGFLEASTDGGLKYAEILKELQSQYRELKTIDEETHIVLWFDACLFDQSMLCHLLTCLHLRGLQKIKLLCIDAFPGIEPYNGLGQLTPQQLASCFENRRAVSDEQFEFAEIVDNAFATQNFESFKALSALVSAPLPWIPAAVKRWLDEQPHPETGFGKLETLVLKAIADGKQSPGEIFRSVAAADTPPQYWGDSTLWAKINGLAERKPALVHIEGPTSRIPQWESPHPLQDFKITLL